MSKPVFEDLFAFKHRRNRKSYFLIQLLVGSIIAICALAFNAFHEEEGALLAVAFVAILLILVCAYICFATSTQRARDFGWTGWSVLLWLIPIVGFVYGLALLFIPGTAGANRYGADCIPDNKDPTKTKALFVFTILPFLLVNPAQAQSDTFKQAFSFVLTGKNTSLEEQGFRNVIWENCKVTYTTIERFSEIKKTQIVDFTKTNWQSARYETQYNPRTGTLLDAFTPTHTTNLIIEGDEGLYSYKTGKSVWYSQQQWAVSLTPATQERHLKAAQDIANICPGSSTQRY